MGVRLYLGCSYFNDQQKQVTDNARKALLQNKSIDFLYFAFEHQYHNILAEKEPVDLAWELATFKNDVSAMSNSTYGLFLYDMAVEDTGQCFELGYLYNNHIPVTLVAYNYENNDSLNLMIKQGVNNIITLDEATKDDNKWLKEHDFNIINSEPQTDFKVF